MTQEEALLEAIRQQPDDDAPRLVRELTFYQEKPDFVPALAAHPALHRLDAVTLYDCTVPPDAIGTFVDSPYVANLGTVSFYGSRVTGPTATAAFVRLLQLPK